MILTETPAQGKIPPVDNALLSSTTPLFWGYAILAVSLLLYGIEEFVDVDLEGENIAIFFVHYILAITYTLFLLANRSLGILRSWKSEHIHKTTVLLNIFLISAYALNREIPVFENSTPWLCCYLIISSGAIISFNYFNVLPEIINKIQYVLLGTALTLYIYLAFYSANFFALGGLGTIAFGIGAHILVPAFLVTACLMLITTSRKEKTISFLWIALGFVITITITSLFVIQWNTRVKAIEKLSNLSVLNSETELPAWVRIAQTVDVDWLGERILKSDLVYTVANDHLSWDFLPNRVRWDEARKHDPLVFIASLTRKISLSRDERITILKAISTRHNAEDRLWSGENLRTSYITTDTDIYPDLRLAYTENYFTIRNDVPSNRSWRNTEEAIYTFQLPEGSVVTSLSLWVNGNEEKAILTSKQKAVKAYNTIVGVEQRDPSVVHWQEGNTVTVRIFPCTPNEERKFKLGITSPLPEENGRLTYKRITFRGPDASKSEETWRVRFVGNPQELIMPDSFERNVKGEYFSEQDHDSNFNISFKSIPVKANHFSFDGFTYSLSPYIPAQHAVKFSRIYLDVNDAWSQEELEGLRPLLTSHKVCAFADDQFVELNDDNWAEVGSYLIKNNFSIFPFHHLKNPEECLVISKGKDLSPFLADFKESKFATGIGEFFGSKRKVHVYNISSSTSTYIRSLKELRAFEFASGSIEQLNDLLQQGQFPVTSETEQEIALHDSKMLITKKPIGESTGSNTAPDHLARLFAYNNIMRKVGSNFFTEDFIREDLVDEASTAYVVSPVSSLIVLETKEDYERFDIADKDNSLHNASKQSSGAVPEPHEWALIFVFACVILFCIQKQYSKHSILSK